RGCPGSGSGLRGSSIALSLRRLQELLHDERVDPLAVEHALLAIDADAREAEPLVEPDAARVGRKGRQHHLMVADLARELDEALEESVPHALATPGTLDVDGEVGHVAVGRARIEDVETAPADDRVTRFCHDDGMARAARGHPFAPFLRTTQLGLERRDAVLDPLVVDPADRLGVAGPPRTEREGQGQAPMHPNAPVTSVVIAVRFSSRELFAADFYNTTLGIMRPVFDGKFFARCGSAISNPTSGRSSGS